MSYFSLKTTSESLLSVVFPWRDRWLSSDSLRRTRVNSAWHPETMSHLNVGYDYQPSRNETEGIVAGSPRSMKRLVKLSEVDLARCRVRWVVIQHSWLLYLGQTAALHGSRRSRHERLLWGPTHLPARPRCSTESPVTSGTADPRPAGGDSQIEDRTAHAGGTRRRLEQATSHTE